MGDCILRTQLLEPVNYIENNGVKSQGMSLKIIEAQNAQMCDKRKLENLVLKDDNRLLGDLKWKKKLRWE